MEYFYSRIRFLAIISITVFLYASLCVTKAHSATLIDLPILQQQVTGVVTDNNGLPIPGVAVRVKDASIGTVTNSDGVYSISVASDATLIFTYMGFEPMEVAVDARMEISIRLEEDVTALGEVQINAGYYHTTRRESTGNISRVTAEEIELQPLVSPIQALQGRMAGVEITSSSSHAGAAPTIRIRGRNSLRDDGNLPLYIIDGVPVNATPIESNTLVSGGFDPLNTLDLSNIESIEVLKDADATAIYGSRGANGVVLVSTKKGGPGKSGFEARVYTGAATAPYRLNFLDTEQYLQIRRKAFENDGEEPTPSNAYDLVTFDQNRYTDWQELVYGGTSSITDINIATSGGNANTSYRLNGSYHTQGTVYPGDYNYNKVTAGLNLNHVSDNKRLRLNLSANYGIDNNELAGHINYSSVFRLPPNAPAIFNETGSLSWEPWDEAGLSNPFAGFFNNSTTDINNLVSNMVISYELLPGLTIRSSFGYTNFSSRELIKRPKRSYNTADSETAKHRSSHLQNFRTSWIIEPQVTYSRKIGKGQLDALLGSTFQASHFNTFTFQGEGYVTEELIGNLTAAEEIYNARSQNSNHKYNAIFGRLGLNWDKRYFLNLTGRRDGSSRFGPGKQFANFWAIGSAWIFSEDKNNKLLSFGKLRASYGTTGNDQIGDYGYLDAYEATPGPGGLYPVQLANPDYSWEVNKKLEASLELGFFQDRLNLGVSWYRNRSSNQLIGYPLPSTTGFTTVQANLPATVQNTGLEIEISSLNISTKNFLWQSSVNMSLPENKLISYPDIEQSSHAQLYKVGHPLDISFLYNYEGLDPETGFYHFTDINENGRFDFEDRIVIHHTGKEFFGGISNSLSYRNISLNFLLDFVKQKGTVASFDAGHIAMQRSEVIEALDEDSKFQRISASRPARDAYSNVLNSSFPIVDASFLRLRTLTLSYSLPQNFLDTTGIKEGRIFLNGQNLLTLTGYKGMHPERPIGGTQFSGLFTITGGFQVKI